MPGLARIVYVSNGRGDTVTPIDTATNTAGPPVPVGSGPWAIAVTPDGSTAYVIGFHSQTVTPIATATNTPGPPIPVGKWPHAIMITPDGATAYVTSWQDGTVTPIATATNTPGPPIHVGEGARAIAITPDGETAYVVVWAEPGAVVPFATATNTPGPPIQVGNGPYAIAIAPLASGRDSAELLHQGDAGLSLGGDIRLSTRWRALSSGNTARSTASAAARSASLTRLRTVSLSASWAVQIALSRSVAKHQVSRLAAVAGGLLAATLLTAACSSAATSSASSSASSGPASATSTVWLCKPGMSDDPCINSLATTAVTATGARSVSSPKPTASTTFACFYVYGTVSGEPSVNADLRRGKAEITTAEEQGTPFSPVCQVYAPIYRQVTVAGLETHPDLNLGPAETVTAYDSIKAGFEDFLTHELDGRPLVVIGDSQGAAMLNMLLARLVDNVPALRSRLVTAIILGGNVEVPAGQLVGGTFKHIPACSRLGETGCVIAYSSFPSTPPADSLFGRAGQGVSLQSGQTARQGLQVVCVNPAALSGGPATLGAVFPSLLQTASTPWVSYPGLYTARCEQSDGASWLNVSKATGPADHRPTVTENLGPAYGYHVWDLGLAQDNLVSDVAAAEITWTHDHR